MKKFLALILISSVVVGLSVNSASANEEKANAKIPYDQCGEFGASAFLQEFPNVKTFKKYYPNILAKGNSLTPPFYGKGFFNLACGGTALSGIVNINKANQVTIETCGDLAVQNRKEACTTLYRGKYKDLYFKGNGYILRDGKIFMIEKTQVTVTEMCKDE